MCTSKAIGPGGGIVFFEGVIEPWGQFIEVSKQTLGPDKLCDSERPRAWYGLWPDYDGIGNGYRANSDLYDVCKKGLVGKVYGHSQTSPVYDVWWLNDQSSSAWIPVVENCCKDWRLPTLQEAKTIYALNSGQYPPGRFCGQTLCEDFKVENGWYYTATPNLEPNKCGYWAINMADGQTKSVKPNEQLRGLMVRNFGPRTTEYRLPRSPIPERSELESKDLGSLQKLFASQFKYFPDQQTPATKEGIIGELLKHPNAVKKVSCSAPATTTTTTTVAPPTTVKKVVKRK